MPVIKEKSCVHLMCPVKRGVCVRTDIYEIRYLYPFSLIPWDHNTLLSPLKLILKHNKESRELERPHFPALLPFPRAVHGVFVPVSATTTPVSCGSFLCLTGILWLTKAAKAWVCSPLWLRAALEASDERELRAIIPKL